MIYEVKSAIAQSVSSLSETEEFETHYDDISSHLRPYEIKEDNGSKTLNVLFKAYDDFSEKAANRKDTGVNLSNLKHLNEKSYEIAFNAKKLLQRESILVYQIVLLTIMMRFSNQ